MRHFYVRFHCVRDIQEFVARASRQKQKLLVGSDLFQVNATSFMGLFALNCRRELKVSVQCSEEEFARLLDIFAPFLAQ